MKKIVLLMLLSFMLFLKLEFVSAETCTYTYAYSEYYAGKEENQSYAEGAKIELEMPSKKGKVTEISEGDTTCMIDYAFNFGEENTLSEWNKSSCPLYIVAYADKGNWYGYDEKPDLSKFISDSNTKKLKAETGMHIFLNNNPSEDVYTCNYGEFEILFDGEGKAISANSLLNNSGIRFSYNLDTSLKDLSAEEPGKCENVWTCQTTAVPSTSPGIPSIYHYNVYSGSIDINKSECLNSPLTLFEYVIDEEISDEGDNPTCRTYKNKWDILKASYMACSNYISECSLYKQNKEKLVSYCNFITDFADYDDPCLNKCLKLKSELTLLEGTNYGNGECGFSGRLISFISNILRWAKYILPVIVIVLGILDFMKAMGADKEDEMKKAQQRFIKRLIAAALLFIVPLILEFVLDKMGFGYDDCGLF